MAHDNNPAGRLLKLLREGTRITPSTVASDAWATLLNVSPNDKSTFLRRLATVYELPALVRSSVEGVPNIDQEVYLARLPQIAKALQQHQTNAAWGSFVKSIKAETLESLRFCDELLSRECPDKRVDTDELGPLLEDVRSLLSEVIANDIDHTLKQYMLKHLHMVERAIEDYQLFGTGPLERAVEATIGSVFLNKDVAVEVAKTPLGAALWKLLGKLAIITSLVVGVPQLPETIRKLLPTPEEVKDEMHGQQAPEIVDVEQCEPEDKARE